MAEQGPSPHLTVLLLRWYDTHARNLPWRAKPGVRPEPYHVWLSEIMLQQTTVAAVKAYYLKFLARWPRVQDLAAASQEEVLQNWAGLGYYARARNLHACAKAIVQEWGGMFPNTEAELLKLPGIGPYTAGAIAAIAYDAPHAAVDGNVERVMSRLYAIETPLPLSKPEIRRKAEALVPPERAGDFAQSLMDLGATICTPKSPNCLICPCSEYCEARKLNIQAELPRKIKKAKMPTRYATAFVIVREDGFILLRQRPEKGLLGNMLEVPSTPWTEAKFYEITPPVDATWQKLQGHVEHTFTHFRFIITVWHTTWPARNSSLPDNTYRWVRADALAGQALPTVMRKIIAFADTEN